MTDFDTPFLAHAEKIYFGCKPLSDVLVQQLELVEKVRQQPEKAFILYGEHPPVYTVGRALKTTVPDTLMGIPVVALSRGGQLTYHGPGQLVIYPIVAIKAVGGVPGMLRGLERWIGQTLDSFGLTTVYPPPCGTPDRPATGVWLADPLADPAGPRKVASIGLALKHWVSYHGVALNVCNPLVPFYAISPCGFTPQVMTSVHHHALQHMPGKLPPSMAQIIQKLGLSSQLI